jgi:hypothetical protein
MMVHHVLNTRINIHLIKKLLIELKKKIDYSNLNHIGSQKLWSNHQSLVNKWLKRLKNYDKKFWAKSDEDKDNLSGLPYDCKIEIIRRINCGHDLIHFSECNKELNNIICKEEVSLWRELCFYKFTFGIILAELRERKVEIQSEFITNHDLDWKSIYFKLNARHLPQEVVYVDIVQKCAHCKCLYWKVNVQILFSLKMN